MQQLTDEELVEITNVAMKNFRGMFPELQSAIGALFTSQQVGWKVMLLIHDKKTLRKYEKILNITFRDIAPEVGPLAHKSVAWKAVQKVSNFWKAVKGEIPGIRSPKITA